MRIVNRKPSFQGAELIVSIMPSLLIDFFCIEKEVLYTVTMSPIDLELLLLDFCFMSHVFILIYD